MKAVPMADVPAKVLSKKAKRAKRGQIFNLESIRSKPGWFWRMFCGIIRPHSGAAKISFGLDSELNSPDLPTVGRFAPASNHISYPFRVIAKNASSFVSSTGNMIIRACIVYSRRQAHAFWNNTNLEEIQD